MIDIAEECSDIGCDKSKGMFGLHAFSGAHFGGKFASSKSLGIWSECNNFHAIQMLGEDDFDQDSVLSVLKDDFCGTFMSKTVKPRKYMN